MTIRTMSQVISDIINVTKKDGFIYALLMMMRRDNFASIEEYHLVDYTNGLITEEYKLLLGFWIKNDSNKFNYPKELSDLSIIKKEISTLMEELHETFINPSAEDFNLTIDKFTPELWEQVYPINHRIKEAVFYGGDILYDYEYVKFLSEKYKYDADWLRINRGFICAEVVEIAKRIKGLVSEKHSRIPHIPAEFKTLITAKNNTYEENILSDFIEYLEVLAVYFTSDDAESRKIQIEYFCNMLLEMFSIHKSEVESLPGITCFLDNFSLNLDSEHNDEYFGPGYFNKYDEAPLLKVGEDVYFVPMPYVIFNAMYDAPFYWMNSDLSYVKRAGSNRGDAGEEITYEILEPIFGEENTYKNIVIKDKHNRDVTDIDILCVYGNKAICIQVKSKRLTLLSKRGDLQKLQKDFKDAVQNAYNQGLTCRKLLLSEGDERFIDRSTGKELTIRKKLNEVYIVCLTTENYPALTSQVAYLLSKKDDDPSAIAFSVFDLALMAHYLTTPYDFLYYIRQRLATYKVFIATNEIVYLGYHLLHKLWDDGTTAMVMLTNEYAQCVDRNYYPELIGVEVSNEGDRIANRWINNDFKRLCNDISRSKSPTKVDVLFALYDLSSECIDNLFEMIKMARERSKRNHTIVTLTLVLDGKDSLGGISYTANSLEPFGLLKEMEVVCATKKYQAHADKWMSLGSNVGSESIVDALLYQDSPWQYDPVLEWACKEYDSTDKTTTVLSERKLGRNDLCYCGSGRKYKKCHGAK